MGLLHEICITTIKYIKNKTSSADCNVLHVVISSILSPTRLSSPPPNRSTAPICMEDTWGTLTGGPRSRLSRSPSRSPWLGITLVWSMAGAGPLLTGLSPVSVLRTDGGTDGGGGENDEGRAMRVIQHAGTCLHAVGTQTVQRRLPCLPAE